MLAQVVLHVAELRVDARHRLELTKRCARERRNLLGSAVRGFEVAGLVGVDHAELVAVLRRLRADLHRRCVQPLVVGPVRGALQRSPRADGERRREHGAPELRLPLLRLSLRGRWRRTGMSPFGEVSVSSTTGLTYTLGAPRNL